MICAVKKANCDWVAYRKRRVSHFLSPEWRTTLVNSRRHTSINTFKSFT